MSEERDVLRRESHDYDGILEYDNPLPIWWLYLFYVTIAFSFCYMGYYTAKGAAIARVTHQGKVLSWSTSMLALDLKDQQAKSLNLAENAGKIELASYITQVEHITSGAIIFAANCIACHGAKGEGSIGPNLLDEYWIHGHTPEAILKVIATGAAAQGMPAWGPVLGDKKVRDLTAYIQSIHGNVVANAKAPQGEKIERSGALGN